VGVNVREAFETGSVIVLHAGVRELATEEDQIPQKIRSPERTPEEELAEGTADESHGFGVAAVQVEMTSADGDCRRGQATRGGFSAHCIHAAQKHGTVEIRSKVLQPQGQLK
jgi:hypothetical protein